MVNFDRLTFSEVTDVYTEFINYCKDLEDMSEEPEDNTVQLENWSVVTCILLIRYQLFSFYI